MSYEQYKICVEHCGIVTESDRSLLQISGNDRAAFLQGLFTQDVARDFPAGKSTYGLFTNVKGRILADAFVSHWNDRFWLDLHQPTKASILKYLNQYLILMNAEIQDRSEEFAHFVLLGPQSASVIEMCFGVSNLAGSCVSLEGETGIVFSSSNHPRLSEIRLFIKKDFAEEILSKLQSAGAALVDREVYDVLKIESAVVSFDSEPTQNAFPQELVLDDALNFKKGCFVGAEVLQRIFYQGHVNRTLALLSVKGTCPLSTGTAILQGEMEVGEVITSLFSYRWNQFVALALVKTSALESGDTSMTILQVFQNVPT